MAPGPLLDLSGTWRAAPASDEALRLRYVDDDLDDGGWEPVAVPGHWRSTPAFHDHDGPLLYRTRFAGLPDGRHTVGFDEADRRHFLVFDGVFAASDVWLDGAYLGDTSGYLGPHTFEVTDALRDRDDHLLAMEVACGAVGGGKTRDLTGAFGRSALMGDGHNPGGIWGPVTVRTTGPVQLRYSRLRCRSADPARATLAIRAVVETRRPRTITLRTSIRPAVGADGTSLPTGGDAPLVIERDHPLATGENRVEWTVDVPQPQLWWPRALGGQPLYDVTVDVLVDDVPSDGRTWRTGLRRVEMDDFVCRVNGERLFLKGIAVGPTRLLVAEATADDVVADVALAAEAGLDLLRVHGHVGRPELYDAADAAGLLVWQDLPLQWGLQRVAKGPARRLARTAVDLLAHHPSIGVWCAHHEPWVADPRTRRDGSPAARRRRRLRRITAQALPSWNRSILDRAVALVLEKSDGSRPVIAHSGVWPHPPQMSGTSTHLWAGWRWGEAPDLARLLHWWPRLGRFVGEFGGQAPGVDAVGLLGAATAAWPALDWADVAVRTGLDVAAATRAVPPRDHPGPAEWTHALQTHQAELVRGHVETLRRLKYRPTGGFAAFALADPAPGITAALLDHERRPKPAWDAFVAACAPLVAIVDPPPASLEAGTHHPLELHVVNDLRRGVAGLRVTATATWVGRPRTAPSRNGADRPDPAGEPRTLEVRRQGWEGDVDADTVARIGTVQLDVPPGATGLALDIELGGPDGLAWRRHHERPVHDPA
jgi:beta-mannosidase